MSENRRIVDHVAHAPDAQIEIITIDVPGAGGANHIYQIAVPDGPSHVLNFQNGPINEVGVNGLTQEALIAVCIDRLRSFQAGPCPCRENALALTKLEEAMHWLHWRTRGRTIRGVEGKSLP